VTVTVPDWRTSTAGTRIRAALWLHTEVGVGGTFTKAQLRNAFPNVEQIDRRMRDLRAEGWVIATYREDRSLAPDELRLVDEGGPVWQKGYRSRAASAVTDKDRQAAFAADGYACTHCGIMAGETYLDDPLRTAKLSLAGIAGPSGFDTALLTVCDRCHSQAEDVPFDALAGLEALSPEQRQRLAGWIAADSRPEPPEETFWRRYRRLPATIRRAVEERLSQDVG
jgi:hypothetical protein